MAASWSSVTAASLQNSLVYSTKERSRRIRARVETSPPFTGNQPPFAAITSPPPFVAHISPPATGGGGERKRERGGRERERRREREKERERERERERKKEREREKLNKTNKACAQKTLPRMQFQGLYRDGRWTNSELQD